MNWNVFQWNSLKTKISLATLSIFLAGIWSLSFYASQMLRKDMEDLLGEQQFSTVSMVAAQVNRELESRLKALEVVAGAATQVMQDGPAAIQTFVEQRLTMQTMFNGGIVVHDINGTAIADFPLPATRVGINFIGVDVVAAALREGKSSISRPVLGKTLKHPVLGVAVPIRDAQGKIIGAISGVTNLGTPNFLDQITDSHYGKTGGYLLVAPQHRLIVTATDKSRIMETLPDSGVNPLVDRFVQGYEGSSIGINPLGEDVLASAKGIPAAGWYAVATLPVAEAFAPIRDMQQRMLMATLVLTLLAGWLTWWMLKRQLSPLLVTAKTLAALSDTSQSLQALPIVREDEIGQLIGGFNRLLKTLGQREALLKQVLDTSSVAIFLVDMDGRIMQANQRMAEMFGLPLDVLVGSEYAALVHPSERETGRQKMLALLSSALPSVDLDRLYWRTDRTEFWGHLTGKRFHDANGEKRGLIGVIADISVRKNAEQAVLKSKRQYDDLAANIPVGIYILRSTSEGAFALDYVSPRMAEMLDLSVECLLADGEAVYQVIHPDDLDGFVKLNQEGIQHRRPFDWKGRVLIEGMVKWLHFTSVPELKENGDVLWHGLIVDITEGKEHEKQLENIAHYDVLTTLPNRVLLADRLHQAMSQEQRRGQLLAVAYLDLDGFKAINDNYGHETGDQLLIALSSRMKHALRDGDTLARLGGDEFVAVLLDLVDAASSVPTLTRLLDAAAQPVTVGDLVLQVSASLGVTFYPQADDVDADQLLRQADQAMYQAKVAGKNRYHVFDAEQDRSVRGHHESLQRIRRALAEREFVLYYQPKVNMRTGVVIGAEALIRWQHPDKGLLPPGVFLPAIENHALATEVGEWVINAALAQMELWRAAGLDIPVSVNVGARQLQQADFVERLHALLAGHPGVRPSDLSLEVLETSALEDVDRASHVIEACQEIGVMFALDDFGTGYSSLTYLKRLPVTLLKIDQSFVHDMLDDPDDLTILEGVIGLATAFRRQVIAEGVETVEHGEMLLLLGCELAQGYGIARPMPAAELPGWALAWRPDSAWYDLPAVEHDDLPLLFAGVEHRAWVAAMESFLRDESYAPPPLDPHQCRFGLWLDGEGKARHGAQSAFAPIDDLHRQVHALAVELVEFHGQGRNPEALSRLGELHALRDKLLAQMQIMVRESRQ